MVPGGSELVELVELGPHAVGDREGVGGRLAHDAEPDRDLARLVELEARVLRADLDAGDLAEAHQVAVLVRDDDLLELLRRRRGANRS